MPAATDHRISASIGLVAPLTGPAAPFFMAAAALVNVGESIYHMFSHPDPAKEDDTAVVEAFMAAFHTTWYMVTGEALPGIPGVTATAQAGQYGAAGINLFQASAYPNVPYPAANAGIDMNAVLNSLANSYQAAAQSLRRPESQPNLRNNFNYALGLLQQVASAQQASGLAGLGSTSASSMPSWLIPALAVVALVVIAK